MKNLIYLLFVLPVFANAQTVTVPVQSPNYSNEIGITFLSVNDLSVWNNGKVLHASVETRCPVGVMYNHHFGKNTLRFYADYFVHVIDVNNDAIYHYYYRASGADRNLGLNIGYQREFRIHKLGINPFADLTFRDQVASGRETAYGCFIYEDNVYFKREKDLFGARIGVNFRYQLNPHIAVSAEFSEGVDREYDRNLLSGTTSLYHYQLYHFNPLDHIGVAFCF